MSLLDYLPIIGGVMLFVISWLIIRKKKMQNITKTVQIQFQEKTQQNLQQKQVDSKIKKYKKSTTSIQKETEQVKPTQHKKSKRKKSDSKTVDESIDVKPKKAQKQIEQIYSNYFYGNVSLKANNSMYTITALCIKNSKILAANSKNQLILYDLKKWKKQSTNQDRYFTSLDNNNASAVTIGNNYYYAALTFDKTIAYYEFKGGEGGVYFKEVAKFSRNIYKSDASSIYVPENEKYIITTGSEADTVINVWSMKGQKLNQLNTYQIEHYDVKYGYQKALVRGWTSQVKLFSFVNQKDGSFSKIEKSHHLTHAQQAKASSIDNIALYALTLTKGNSINLWGISSINTNAHPTLKTIDCYNIGLDKVQKCIIHTVRDTNERLKTIAVFTDGSKVVICDKNLSVCQTLDGLDCIELYVIGSIKNVVLATLSSVGKLTIWNLTSVVEKLPEYVI